MREVIGSISVKYSLKKFVRPHCNPKHFLCLICTRVSNDHISLVTTMFCELA